MSKKRTSTESSHSTAEEPALNDGGASVFPQDDNAKRVKLTPFSDTTLLDLPIELIESILIKVVAMEVKSMKLSKSVWTEKAELVINRLAAVCSQWSSVLSTRVFRTRLNRALEAQGTIRLEILQQYTIPFCVSGVTALRDEVFLLCPRYLQDHYIIVYNSDNMTEVKYVVTLPELNPERIVACAVSNCVYVFNRKLHNHFSILRITQDNGHWTNVSELIGDLDLPECSFCVTADGSLVISREQTKRHPAISVYNAAGSLLKNIRLPLSMTSFSEIIPKPNGNLVLRGIYDDYYDDDDDDYDDDDDDDNNNDNDGDNNDDNNNDNDDGGNDNDDDNDYSDDSNDDDDDDDDDDYVGQAAFTEIDMNGNKIRQHLCSLGRFGSLGLHASIVDSHGRMLTVSDRNGVQLLDSEFNLMEFTGPQLIGLDQFMFTSLLFHYNSDRNETIVIDKRFLVNPGAYTVFRFKEL